MTKKQIEKMALVIGLAALDADLDGNTRRYREILDKASDYFNLLFDFYMVDDYKKIEKIRSEVFTRAAEIYAEEKAKYAA